MLPSDTATAAGSAAGSSSSSMPRGLGTSGAAGPTGLGSGECGIASPVVEERVSVPGIPAYDLADDDRVVAAGIDREPLALDVGEGPVQPDLAFRADVVADPVEAVVVLVGKPARELLLAAGQDVHHELRRRHDQIVQLGGMVDAHRD